MAKKVRILVDQQIDALQYKANQVVSLPDAIARSLVETGVADDNRDAIAYCTGELGCEVLVHETAAVRAAKSAVAEAEAALDAAKAAFDAETDAEKKAELGKAVDAAAAALKAAQVAAK